MPSHKIFFIKLVHSIIFIFMSFCVLYILYCAIARYYDWTLAVALAAIFIEGVCLLFNRCECPLTTLAKRWGAINGSVTDILLPVWCARNVFKISMILVPIELILLVLRYFWR